MNTVTSSPSLLASLSVDLKQSSGLLHILPAGEFRCANDDRPHEVQAWVLTTALAQQVISRFNQSRTELVVDYEHQTLLAKDNGLPAPAAGWVSSLTWDDERGLFGHVRWTKRASDMIEHDEYRYLSPVFEYDSTTGAILRLLHVALTNTPALDNLDAVQTALKTLLINQSNQGEYMDLTTIIKLLGLPAGSSLADCEAAIQAKQEALETQSSLLYSLRRVLDLSETASLTDIQVALKAAEEKGQTIVTHLSQALNDESSTSIQELKKEVAALASKLDARETNDALNEIDLAIKDGRLLPAQKAWAQDLAKKDRAALSSFLATSQPIAALTQTQTSTLPSSLNSNVASLSAEEQEVAVLLGYASDQFLTLKGTL